VTRRAADLPRRFYGEAALTPGAAGVVLALDGRGAKTPAGHDLSLPNEALGAAVAAEWRAQGERIDLAGMPLTRLAFTAIDRVRGVRAELGEEVARYAAHDVLCHLAEAPARLVALQEGAWAPWRAWARSALGVALEAKSGLIGPPQSDAALARVRELAAGEEDFALTGLAFAAALLGSAVLAFALMKGALDADAALDLSRLDEAFQEGFWGVDAEAEKRTAALRLEARAAGRWFDALTGRSPAPQATR
jgi:chaperone required for assembly of F1-ATPase